MGKFKYLKERLAHIEGLVRRSDYYLKSLGENPSLEDYRKFKMTVSAFLEPETHTKYEGVNYYEYTIKMYKQINEEYNKGIYKIPFKQFHKRLAKDGIFIDKLINFSIPEYDKKMNSSQPIIAKDKHTSSNNKTPKKESKNVEKFAKAERKNNFNLEL